MSSSATECWESSGRKQSFSQTCSRLSRYLKENGSFGDLSLGMTCKPDVNVNRQPTMMNLFPCDSSAIGEEEEDIKPKISIPRQSSLSSSSSSGTKEETHKIIETNNKSVKQESQSNSLTIFYGGQVLVFDDFSADKAKQVIDLANKGSVKIQKEIVSTNTIHAKPVAHEHVIQTNTSALACELPIARRASLHRFLAKRKDRITSKAPYQVDGSSAEASSKPNTAWLGSQ